MTAFPTTFEDWMSDPMVRCVFIRNALEHELRKAAGEHAEMLETHGFQKDIVIGAERKLEGQELQHAARLHHCRHGRA
jgi:hypothetical protein